MNSFKAGFISGLIICSAIMFAVTRPSGSDSTPKPYVTPISGEPIIIKSVTQGKDIIKYTTIYAGAGESILNVPLDSIPEARAWRHNVWSTTAMYLTDGTVGLMKGYRINRAQLSAGLWTRIPRWQTLHYKSQSSSDAGLMFAVTLHSDSLLL